MEDQRRCSRIDRLDISLDDGTLLECDDDGQSHEAGHGCGDVEEVGMWCVFGSILRLFGRGIRALGDAPYSDVM